VAQPVATEEESEEDEDEPLVPEEAALSQAAVMAKAAESGAALCEC